MERNFVNRTLNRHNKVLESKLKIYFVEVISDFVSTEFETVFQMFILSISTVFESLDPSNFNEDIFKYLVLLLVKSLKNSEHSEVFSILRLTNFSSDCLNLLNRFKESQGRHPGITNRISLLFKSSLNSREYFRAVIDATTNDSI